MRGDDDAGCAGAFGAADHRTEVARISDLVEAGQERLLGGRELVGVGVAVRLRPGEHTLMIAGAGGLADLPIRLDLEARSLLQPRFGRDGALCRPDLEDLAPSPKRLAHRPAAVDLVSRHCLGTRR